MAQRLSANQISQIRRTQFGQGRTLADIDAELKRKIASGEIQLAGAGSEAPISDAVSTLGLPGKLVGGATRLLERPLRTGFGQIAEEIGQAKPGNDVFDKIGTNLLTPEQQLLRGQSRGGDGEAKKQLIQSGLRKAAGAAALLPLSGKTLAGLPQAVRGGKVLQAAKLAGKQGLVSGGLSASSEDDAGLAEILKGSAVGGAGGAIIGGGLAAIPKAQTAIRSRANRIAQESDEVAKIKGGGPEVKITGKSLKTDDISFSKKVRAMQDRAKELNINRSQTPLEQADIVAKTVADDAGEIAKLVEGKTFDKTSWADDLNTKFAESGVDLDNVPKNTREFWGNKLANVGDDAEKLSKLKSSLTKTAAKVDPTSPTKAYLQQIHASTVDALGGVSDDIAIINQRQAVSYNLSKEIATTARADKLIRAKLPFDIAPGLDVELPITTQALDAKVASRVPLSTRVGGLTGKVSTSLSKLPQISSKALGGAAVPLTKALSASISNPITGEVEVPVTDGALDRSESIVEGATSGLDLSEEKLRAVLEKDLATTGGANISKIVKDYETLTKVLGDGSGGEEAIGESTRTAATMDADLDFLEEQILSLSVRGKFGVGATRKQTSKLFPDTAMKDFVNQREILVAQLGPALGFGSGRFFSENERQMVRELLPQVTDSASEIRASIENLKLELKKPQVAK